MKKGPLFVSIAAAFLLILSAGSASAAGKILVYSPWKDEIMRSFGEMFAK
jgi:hypothetical protein